MNQLFCPPFGWSYRSAQPRLATLIVRRAFTSWLSLAAISSTGLNENWAPLVPSVWVSRVFTFQLKITGTQCSLAAVRGRRNGAATSSCSGSNKWISECVGR
jgi:hypothetical protein